MKFRPLLDRVVVKRIEADEKWAGGIIIPDTAKESPRRARSLPLGRAPRRGAGTTRRGFPNRPRGSRNGNLIRGPAMSVMLRARRYITSFPRCASSGRKGDRARQGHYSERLILFLSEPRYLKLFLSAEPPTGSAMRIQRSQFVCDCWPFPTCHASFSDHGSACRSPLLMQVTSDGRYPPDVLHSTYFHRLRLASYYAPTRAVLEYS
jgi:hypothetical protein